MTTAAQAIQRISEATGILPATVFRAARALREEDVALWPQGEKGKGRAAHVEPHHLVNLMLALATDAITSAPAAVSRYRSFTTSKLVKPKQLGSLGRMLLGTPTGNKDRYLEMSGGVLGANLGEDLGRLIELIATNADAREALDVAGLTIEIDQDQTFPGARIFYIDGDAAELTDGVFYSPEVLIAADFFTRHLKTPPPADALLETPRPVAALQRSTKIPYELLAVLGEMYADTLLQRFVNAATRRHRGATPPEEVSPLLEFDADAVEAELQRRTRRLPHSQPDAPASATSENETAATPARDAAALNDCPATAEQGGLEQSHPMGVRENSQALSESQDGHSAKRQRNTPHDRKGRPRRDKPRTSGINRPTP